jgi:hypothetical protein
MLRLPEKPNVMKFQTARRMAKHFTGIKSIGRAPCPWAPHNAGAKRGADPQYLATKVVSFAVYSMRMARQTDAPDIIC